MQAKLAEKIALGTAQLGLHYGIANTTGQVSLQEAAKIVSYAAMAGMNTLDTAISYGESEERLGQIGIQNWKVVSKLPAIEAGSQSILHIIEEEVRCSLERMKIDKLYGLLLHRSNQLLREEGKEIYSALQILKEKGFVEKIGISVYGPEELSLYDAYHFDLIQLPFNIIDRRFIRSNWLKRLADKDIEIHARSIFLQGLLLMQSSMRPAWFSRWDSLWNAWEQFLSTSGVSAVEACLSYVLSCEEISKIVVGVESVEHLQQIIAASERESPTIPSHLLCDDAELLNPSQWKLA